jgi:hypothetical protein
MSAKYEKGTRVAIVAGKQGKGMRGEVFWIGDSRYGKGSRYGVRGDDGETYWIDEDKLGPEDAVPPPTLPEASAAPLEKGTRVTIVRGDHAGHVGEIFWVGESRYGKGPRYGVRGDDGETYWVDGPGVEALDEPPKDASAAKAAKSPPKREPKTKNDAAAFQDDAPLPDDGDFAMPENEGGYFDDEDPPF